MNKVFRVKNNDQMYLTNVQHFTFARKKQYFLIGELGTDITSVHNLKP